MLSKKIRTENIISNKIMKVKSFLEYCEDDQTTIEKLKKGDTFSFEKDGKLFVRDDYNRETKKYDYYSYDDIAKFGSKIKGTKVYVL